MQKLRASGHYLQTEDGQPFFWLADTAWNLIQQATCEDVEVYFERRAAQGFNVVQTVILAEFAGVTAPNRYGHTPFDGINPLTPNEGFFAHVDFVVQAAARHGIYLALLPSWGEWVTPRVQSDRFLQHPQQMRDYGQFLGARYAEAPNIVWILGGDRYPDEAANGLELWRTLAYTLREQGDWLMSYHCMPVSSTWFADDDWMSFHAFGSYHQARNLPRAYLEVEAERRHCRAKPIVNMEPCYEEIAVDLKPDCSLGVFNADDVRKIAYWSTFAGAMGHSYGHNSIWQWVDNNSRQHHFGAETSWRDALDAEGAHQMQHLKNLLLDYPVSDRIPDQSLIRSDVGEGGSHIRALYDAEGSYALVYIPGARRRVVVDLGYIAGETAIARWFDPRNGSYQDIDGFATEKSQAFTTPESGVDWVLVLENSATLHTHDAKYGVYAASGLNTVNKDN